MQNREYKMEEQGLEVEEEIQLLLVFFYLCHLLPWHSLNQTFTEVVEGNGHLHHLISYVGVAMAQQHHLPYIF